MNLDANRTQEIFLRAIAFDNVTARNEFVASECGTNIELKSWVEEILAIYDRAISAPIKSFDPIVTSGFAAKPSPLIPDVQATTDLNTDDLDPDPPKRMGPTVTFDPDAGSPSSLPDANTPRDPNAGTVPHPNSDNEGGTVTYHPEVKRRVQREKADPELGKIIGGKYTLVSVIGEGGMGCVYLARQTAPIKREVALKLIKAGFASHGVAARFEVERQALALMEHPNIARVYDGGTTPTGAPYFVMELVRGVPITTYCDEKHLPILARLDLFVQVCRAVQHAHQKGIIHRDLKPGNILVMEVDGKPTPKVIDFGVAKATEQRLTDSSFDDVGAIVGTPMYMSPEQADPSSMDIDTRTDVYALGVVLYELLTGSAPIQPKDFRRGAILEMLRMVREVEPPRPSTRVSSDNALPNIAANRAVEPGQLLSILRGDIDWIVMKAIEKNRENRYESAIGFATDILHYLSYEPVVARPPTRSYRLRKFVRRNRTAVSLGIAFLFVALTGVAGVILQWREAEFQRIEAVAAKKEAETNSELAITAKKEAESSLKVAMEQRMVALKAVGQMVDISRKELPKVPGTQELQKKVLTIVNESLRNIAENALVQVSLKDTTLAAVHASIARMHLQLGDVATGVKEFHHAEDIYERILKTAPEGIERDTVKQNLAVILMALAQTSLRTQSTAEARTHLDRAKELMGELGPTAPLDFRRNLTTLLRMVGAVTSNTNPREGRRLYGDALQQSEAIARQDGSNDNQLALLDSYLLVGGADFRLRDSESCEKYYRLAVKVADAEVAKSNQLVWRLKLAMARERLGDLFLRTGKPGLARDEYRAVVVLFQALAESEPTNIEAGANHSRTLYSLALAEERLDDKVAAAGHFKTSLAIRDKRVRDKPEGVALKDLMATQARNRLTREALDTAETVLKQFSSDPSSLVDVACCFAICSGVMPADAAGKEATERHATRAVEILKKAMELGYRDIVNLETEPDLDALRLRDDFKKLLTELANKNK